MSKHFDGKAVIVAAQCLLTPSSSLAFVTPSSSLAFCVPKHNPFQARSPTITDMCSGDLQQVLVIPKMLNLQLAGYVGSVQSHLDECLLGHRLQCQGRS